MRLRHTGGLLFAVLLLSACDNGSVANAPIASDDQKASYGIGFDMGRNLAPAQGHLDMAAFRRGLEDALAKRDQAVPQEEVQAALQAFSQAVMEEQQAERTAAAEKNKTDGEAFLAQNATKEGVMVTESGLQYEVLTQGEGERPDSTDRVRVHYTGTLIDGTQFESSHDRGEPAEFGLGGGVIDGFDEAIRLMPVGSTYRVWIPSELAYGEQGSGQAIGPNQVLVFELELLEIVE